MPRFFFRISYKGTAFAGWQIQENAVGIQQRVNEAFATVFGYKVETTGCGRTDTGVHASRFYLHADLKEQPSDPRRLLYSLNALVPEAIVFHEVISVHDSAHARFDATQRTYRYFISRERNPFMKEYSWGIYGPLDLEVMQACADRLVGSHDFSSFEKTGADTGHSLCQVTEARWTEAPGLLVFQIAANRFLRNMVRALVGTLVETGNGKRSVSEFESLLKGGGSRADAGPSVPAAGLFLTDVRYPYIETSPQIPLFPTL